MTSAEAVTLTSLTPVTPVTSGGVADTLCLDGFDALLLHDGRGDGHAPLVDLGGALLLHARLEDGGALLAEGRGALPLELGGELSLVGRRALGLRRLLALLVENGVVCRHELGGVGDFALNEGEMAGAGLLWQVLAAGRVRGRDECFQGGLELILAATCHLPVVLDQGLDAVGVFDEHGESLGVGQAEICEKKYTEDRYSLVGTL